MKFFSVLLLLFQSFLYGNGFIPQVVKVEVHLNKKSEIIKDAVASNYNDIVYYQNEIIYFDHIPVVLEGISSTQLLLYQQEYYRLAPQLKNSISKITITSNSMNQACGIVSSNKVKGCARSKYNDIILDDIYRSNDLLHESIHLYSYQNDRVFSDVFDQIYYEEGQNIFVQEGNVHNIYEYYVSAYLLYLYQNTYLMKICPKTKQYFDES